MHAAHFVQRYPPALGGSEAYFARLGQFLVQQGERVTVHTTTAVPLEAFWSIRSPCLPPSDLLVDGVRVRRYPLWRCPGRRYLLKPLSLIPHRLWQCLTMPCNPMAFGMWAEAGRATERVDLVHATAFPYAWPIACGLRLARGQRVPFFVTPFLHLGDPDDPNDRTRLAYTSPALLWLLREADGVFVQTEGERNALLERGLPEAKIILQGLGVDPDECTKGNRLAARRRWQAAEDEVVIGHLANNSAEKGSIDLLHAAQRLWQRGRRFRLVLAGPEMPNFRRFWSHFTPAGPVLRLGVLDDNEKRDFFAGIDLFALPSRSDSFGLVLLEAWANGIPNVAYRAGGIADLIHDGDDGLVTPCGRLETLADALDRLILDAAMRQWLGERGRQRVREEFRWRDKLEVVRNAYRARMADTVGDDAEARVIKYD